MAGFLLALGPSCLAAQASAGPSLRGKERALLEATVRIQDAVSPSVWPGFVSFRPAVLLYVDEGQFLFNAPTAPADFKRYAGAAPFWAKTNWWTAERRDVFGKRMDGESLDRLPINSAYSSAQSGGHFPYSVFLIDSLSRYHQKGQPWSAEDWMSIYWHEVFHAYQDTQYSPELVTADRTDDAPLEALISSSTYLSSVREEQEAMRTALKARSPARKRHWACDVFLAARRKRQRDLIANGQATAVRNELFYEASEGTARYVEELMTVQAAALRPERLLALDRGLPLGKDYSRFARFQNRTRDYYYDKIAELPADGKYYYATGFALALFLDQVDPGWKKDVFRTEGFLDTKLQNYCAAAKAGSGVSR